MVITSIPAHKYSLLLISVTFLINTYIEIEYNVILKFYIVIQFLYHGNTIAHTCQHTVLTFTCTLEEN